MIEYIPDIAPPVCSALGMYLLLNKKFDNLRNKVMDMHLTNAKEIEHIKGRLGLD